MVAVADAQAGEDRPYQCFDDYNSGDIVWQRWSLRVASVHLADLIESACPDGVGEYGIQLRNPAEISNLAEDVVCSQQFIPRIGAKAQRTAQRQPRQAEVVGTEACSALEDGTDNASLTDRKEMIKSAGKLRVSAGVIGTFSVVVIGCNGDAAPCRNHYIVLPEVLESDLGDEGYDAEFL